MKRISQQLHIPGGTASAPSNTVRLFVTGCGPRGGGPSKYVRCQDKVYGPFIATRTPLARRHFLRGAGVALSLPLLNAMLPGFSRAQAIAASPLAPGAKPRRMFAIEHTLGFLPIHFFPKGAGRDYVSSPYLDLLKEHRNDFTVFTGVSLPNVLGSHPTEVAWLTGAPYPASSSFKNTISLDQVVAQNIGVLTRFPSIALGINGSNSLSVTGSGVSIPCEQSAARVYEKLFVQGSPAEVEATLLDLETGRSILDTITDSAKDLRRNLGAADRERIDQYFTSVRALEKNLQASEGWERKPKALPKAPKPVDPASPAMLMEKAKVMYDIATLAFQTDSTRAITLFLNGQGTPIMEGLPVQITEGYHGLSHHGKSSDKLTQLDAIDRTHFQLLNGLLNGLKEAKEEGETLLDRTQVLFGSNFHDANAHLTSNLPVVFAGGGWKHGQHLMFDPQQNYPLTNLHLSMLHRMGIMERSFSSSTGTFRGLEMT